MNTVHSENRGGMVGSHDSSIATHQADEELGSARERGRNRHGASPGRVGPL